MSEKERESACNFHLNAGHTKLRPIVIKVKYNRRNEAVVESHFLVVRAHNEQKISLYDNYDYYQTCRIAVYRSYLHAVSPNMIQTHQFRSLSSGSKWRYERV